MHWIKKYSGEQQSLLYINREKYGSATITNDDLRQRNEVSPSSSTCNNKLVVDQKPSCAKVLLLTCVRYIKVWSWSWFNPILRLGYKKILVESDLSTLDHEDQCFVLLNKLMMYDWSTSIWYITRDAFGRDIICAGLLLVPFTVVRLAQPLLLYAIVLRIAHKNRTSLNIYIDILLAIALYTCCIVQAILHQQVFSDSTKVGVRIRNALAATIYRHLLSSSTSSLQQTTGGRIINLMSNDINKIEDFWAYAHFLWQAPLECLLTFFMLIWIIGILPTLLGFVALLILIPLQYFMSQCFSRFHQRAILCKDKRIDAFSKILYGYQVIKMCGWEQPMEEQVLKIREEELKEIRYESHLQAINSGVSFAASGLVAFITFSTIWLLGSELKVADIFTVLTCFSQIRLPLFNLLPPAIERLSLAVISSKRIESFMRIRPINLQQQQSPITSDQKYNNDRGSIIMRDASFSWGDGNIYMTSLNLTIKPGQLIGVVGPVGAGKSSLLAAILGEMHLTSGFSKVNGSISFAVQSPWIFADTIRANILLGKKMDEEHYMRVLRACCLDFDLNLFGEAHDLTVIGDRGVNLSGGQRARVSLARALYADADIYLLDDPLSACDNKVAKRIFEASIGKQGLLHKKTRLFITHQTNYVDMFDQCLVLSNGYIEAIGSADVIRDKYPYFANLKNGKEDRDPKEQEDEITPEELDFNKAVSDANSILHDEIPLSGQVSWSVWRRLYIAPPLRWFGCLLMIFLLLIGGFFFDFTNFWLASWSMQTHATQRQSMSSFHIYTFSAIGTLIAALVRSNYYFYIILRGSSVLHNDMLKRILYAPMSFFQSNPSGRILNRVGQDQQVVDEVLPKTSFGAVQALLTTVGTLIIITILNPWIVILVIIVVPAAYKLHYYYLQTSRQLKRLESVTRSPIYDLFTSSFYGLSTIRAFKVQDEFVQLFIHRIDTNTRAYMDTKNATHWFGVRVDMLALLFTCFVVVFAIATGIQTNVSSIALSLMCCLNMTNRFQWGLLQLAEAQNAITSAERIDEYARLPAEEDNGGDKALLQPPPDWPTHGKIEFQNYTMRYRPESQPILHNINLQIEPGEKIGIIGRTGAGKSSLFQALFRLVHRSAVDGVILIDDIDISRLNLSHLRSKLSIIPQLPIIFGGTVRDNLDPLHTCTDEQCFAALEAVQLKERICNHPNGLYLLVHDSGSNFSEGERQLISAARAILQQRKIVLVDEATANIDQVTAKIIHEIIDANFRDCTVLTISHKLDAVIKTDRILVMEKGTVLNFDIPENILNHKVQS